MAAAVWALGALVILTRLVLSLLRARGLVSRARHLRSERGVRILLSGEIIAPATAGIFAPVVLVPLEALSWDEERWRVVLLHETAHIRARDTLANALAQLVCALHWFDPLAWICARRLRRERELAADERVVLAGTKASDYAEHLLAIAAGGAELGVVGMAEQRSELALRVEALVCAGRRSLPSPLSSATLILGVIGLAIVVACTGASTDVNNAPVPRGTLATEVASTVGATPARVELTIEPSVQKIVDEEMAKVAAEWRASSATAIVLEPKSGAILAMYDPAASSRAYVTGSTLKAVTIGAALDTGVVRMGDRFDCRAYGKLRDASPNGTLGLPELFAVSSNIGTARVFDRLGGARLRTYLARFHFGEAPPVQLGGMDPGVIPATIDDGEAGAIVAIGERATATPIQVAAAYAVFANGGEYVAPTLVRRMVEPARERILGPDAARALMTLLEGVVENGTGNAARLQGVRVAGKTGTADYDVAGTERLYASFVGIVPADAPRYVILVGVETPRTDAWGGRVAAPAFARIASRVL
jgi:hypothetical protein